MQSSFETDPSQRHRTLAGDVKKIFGTVKKNSKELAIGAVALASLAAGLFAGNVGSKETDPRTFDSYPKDGATAEALVGYDLEINAGGNNASNLIVYDAPEKHAAGRILEDSGRVTNPVFYTPEDGLNEWLVVNVPGEDGQEQMLFVDYSGLRYVDLQTSGGTFQLVPNGDYQQGADYIATFNDGRWEVDLNDFGRKESVGGIEVSAFRPN